MIFYKNKEFNLTYTSNLEISFAHKIKLTTG